MLLFIIALLIAGGVIAYVGDRLGTYIGKKRLSAWGLRPRHTAMLYTVLSGGLIAVLTLFALIGYDRTIQRALLYGPQLLAENHRLSQEDRSQRQLIQARAGQVLMADSRAAAAMLQAHTAALQAVQAQSQLQTAQIHLSHAQSHLHQSQAELTRREKQLAGVRKRLRGLNLTYLQARDALSVAQSRLRVAQSAAQMARHNVHVAQVQYDRAMVTVTQLTRQEKSLIARNTVLTNENAVLDLKYQQLLNQTTYLQGAHLIYHKGEEIGRRVIPTDLPLASVRQRLVSFLNDLSLQAADAGASTGDNGRAVVVVTRVPDGNGNSVTEDEALDALSQNIVADNSASSGVVVVAVARYNAFGGEQTPIELHPYDNLLIYHQGQFIADTVINGTLPEDQILGALQEFLINQIQPDARSRGIIPRPDPLTGEPTVGERTNSSQTLALVKQIQRIGANALVTARAAADTYSSGPLSLRLSAAPAPPFPSPLIPSSPMGVK